MFEQVMNNLRAAVKKLEEDELFEQTAVKSADVGLETSYSRAAAS